MEVKLSRASETRAVFSLTQQLEVMSQKLFQRTVLQLVDADSRSSCAAPGSAQTQGDVASTVWTVVTDFCLNVCTLDVLV